MKIGMLELLSHIDVLEHLDKLREYSSLTLSNQNVYNGRFMASLKNEAIE